MAEHNPYAAPQAEIRATSLPRDDAGPVWQQATLRLGGWLGLTLAALVFVTFGLGIYSEFKKIVAADGVFDVAIHREWIAHMVLVGLACILAAITSLCLTRIRGRLALTLVTMVPLPALFFCYLLTRASAQPRPVEQPWGMALGSAFALPFYFVILFVLWSSKRTFAPTQAKSRTGCLTILAALAFVICEGVAYTALVLSAAGMLYLLGLTP
jgi:hypothetical protein